MVDLPSLPTWSFARLRAYAQARLGRVLILHLTIIFGMLAMALTGYGLVAMRPLARLWLGVASVMVISPNRAATIAGLAMAVPVMIAQYRDWARARASPAPAG